MLDYQKESGRMAIGLPDREQETDKHRRPEGLNGLHGNGNAHDPVAQRKRLAEQALYRGAGNPPGNRASFNNISESFWTVETI